MKYWMLLSLTIMISGWSMAQTQWDTIVLFQTYEGIPFRAIAIQEDDYISYTETVDGYTIVLNAAGEWCYATRKGDDLVPSKVRVHPPAYRDEKEQRFLRKLPKHLRYGPAKIDELKLEKLKLYDYERYLRFREVLRRRHSKTHSQ